MKSLFTICKIIPRLGSANENEKMAAFRLIETKLFAEGISWTDVGLRLHEFLTEVAGLEEPAEIPAPAPKAAPSWGAKPAPAPAPNPSNWGPAPPPINPGVRTGAPPPLRPASPRPRQPDPRASGGTLAQLQLIREILSKLWLSTKDKGTAEGIEMLLDSGLPIGRNQRKFLEEQSKLL